jgi:putative membrane protein
MLIIKGIIIGIGKIIPGLSGSMLAISMGIYQKLINSINNFFEDIKGNFYFLFNVFLGVSISIIFFSKTILSLCHI